MRRFGSLEYWLIKQPVLAANTTPRASKVKNRRMVLVPQCPRRGVKRRGLRAAKRFLAPGGFAFGKSGLRGLSVVATMSLRQSLPSGEKMAARRQRKSPRRSRGLMFFREDSGSLGIAALPAVGVSFTFIVASGDGLHLGGARLLI